MTDRIADIQRAISESSALDGWLFYDFRGSDPLAYRILQLDPTAHVTRRWYYWVPAAGTPVKLVHRIEPHVLGGLPGETRQYVSYESQRIELAALLGGIKRVAMQYSPMNAVPYVSRVDAGTLDLVKSVGVEVVSSADLIQRFEAVWTDAQVASHQDAAEGLRRIVDEAFDFVGRRIASGTGLTEYDLQQLIVSRIAARGLTTASPPIAAVNAHSADPHYSPAPTGSSPLQRGDLILIDLWAKRPEPGAVYADITWTAYVGPEVPARQRRVFEIVRRARDAAIDFVRTRVSRGDFPCGWEVDDVCRGVIAEAGYGDAFVHRTGHSIGEEVHGNGANIDNLETKDARRLIPRTCFSIEPGVYLAGEFGIRSEVDVYVSEREARIFGEPIQTAIVALPV